MKIKQTRKSPTRKVDLIKIALDLFNEYGYEKTSINMIIKKANVTKGAFYHYFLSKENIRDEVFNIQINNIKKILEKITIGKRLNASEKLNTFFYQLQEYKNKNKETRSKIKKALLKYQKIELEQKFLESLNEKIGPLLENIFIQGNKEKIFNILYPKELSQTFLLTIIALSKNLKSTDKNNKEEIIKTILFIENNIEKILGTKEKNINILPKYIK